MRTSTITSRSAAMVEAELVHYSAVLHHFQRSFLEYGVPLHPSRALDWDPQYDTVESLEGVCDALRAELDTLLSASTGNQRGIGMIRRCWRILSQRTLRSDSR